MKVCKHPSIWHRDYRWTTTMNGSTQLPPNSVTRKSPRTSKRIIQKEIESDEDLPTEKQTDDLMLNQYISFSEPLQKRFKEDGDSDDQSAEAIENDDEEEEMNGDSGDEPATTPKRNPFKKAVSCNEELLSPTRISKDNNSLVKTQSPVKHIDFRKLEKLSRFSRTLVPQKQRVISRFFTPTTKECEEATVTKSDSGIQEDLSNHGKSDSTKKTDSDAQMKSPNLLDLYGKSPTSTLYFSKGIESLSPPIENSSRKMADDESIGMDLDVESQRSILNKFKFVLKEKIHVVDSDSMEIGSSQGTSSDKTDSESSGLPIVLSDDDTDVDFDQDVTTTESTKRIWLSASQTSKAVSQKSKTISFISFQSDFKKFSFF